MASITIYGNDLMSIRCCDGGKSIYINEKGIDDPSNELRIFIDERHLSQFFAALGEIAARIELDKRREDD